LSPAKGNHQFGLGKIGRYVFGGYRVMTPQANHPIFEHVWMNDVRTFAYVPTGFWVDPLHEHGFLAVCVCVCVSGS